MPGNNHKYYFENDTYLKLTFALKEFTHTFDSSGKTLKDRVEGILSKQAKQMLRNILVSTCKMNNEYAWSLHPKKFILD